MVRLISKLGDRALSRLVPRAKAQAATCHWVSCYGACISKYCCTGTGLYVCTDCKYVC